MEDFTTDEEIRDVRLQCLQIARQFPNNTVQDLMNDAEHLFMWVYGFTMSEKVPVTNSDPESN